MSFRNMANNNRHPPHLKGKEIGLFYAKRNKEKKKKNEDLQRMAVNIPLMDEMALWRLLYVMQNQEYEISHQSYIDFQTKYWSSIAPADHLFCGMMHHVVQRNPQLDEQYFTEFQQKIKSKPYENMFRKRQTLPAFTTQGAILSLLESNNVIVIKGETGCGKTTQVPQYILDSFLLSKKGSLCKIICTQPRRISAIGVSERVAQERCTHLGRNSDIGYQIRLERELPREFGSILFCTTGIVLQHLQSDPFLNGITHIIVDEVHERDILSDFLLITLKNILVIRKDLKVILMSATMNAEEFSSYFGDCPMIEIPGFTYPVQDFMLEDMLELIKYKQDEKKSRKNSNFPRKGKGRRKAQIEQEKELEDYLSSISERYSQWTINALREWDEDILDLDLIVEMLKYICCHGKEGAILVFLPGWNSISSLHKCLTDCGFFSPAKYLIIPLHSLMPTTKQREIFDPPPRGMRKIILSTNIAETSVTINDVVYVIDSGKVKLKNIDSNLQLLQHEWIALSNMKQRRGRAGRTCPGVCYHMFSRLRESKLQPYQLPEMLRSSLEELILNIKILKLGQTMPFLLQAMNPPDQNTVHQSISTLIRLNALTADENLTPLGYHLAKLPMDVHPGKMILLGAIFSCLDPILSVAASLSFKDAFVIPLGREREVDYTRLELSKGTQSDHLMYANVIKQWEEAKAYGTERRFCRENFLSSSTLRMLCDLKGQYAQHLKTLDFLQHSDPKHPMYNRNSGNELLLKAIICAGLYPNVAKVSPRIWEHPRRPHQVSAETEDSRTVKIHPKSVNCYETNLQSGWLVYHVKIKSTEIFLHDTTPVSAYSLLLFGGKLEPGTLNGYETISVDDWIVLHCSASQAKLVMELRRELDDLLAFKISRPGVSNWDSNTKEGLILKCIVQLISSEDTCTVEDLDSFRGPRQPFQAAEEQTFFDYF